MFRGFFQLVAYGKQDLYLTDLTFFKSEFKTFSNFATDSAVFENNSLVKEWVDELFTHIVNGDVHIIKNDSNNTYCLIFTINDYETFDFKESFITGVDLVNFFRKDKFEKTVEQKENMLFGCKLTANAKENLVEILLEFDNFDQYGNVVITI
jgi:hypothetical protein